MFKKIWSWLFDQRPAPPPVEWAPGALDSLKANTRLDRWAESRSLPHRSGNQIKFFRFSGDDEALDIKESDNTPCTAASDSELDKQFGSGLEAYRYPLKVGLRPGEKEALEHFRTQDPAPSIGSWLRYNIVGYRFDESLGQYVKEEPKKPRKKAVKKLAKKTKKGKKRAT